MNKKKKNIHIPPSVQVAASRLLLGKAYKVYHYCLQDGTPESLMPTTAGPHAPIYHPGSKVCLSYNKTPELYVVLSVAYAPKRDPEGDTASSSLDILAEGLDGTVLSETSDAVSATETMSAFSTNSSTAEGTDAPLTDKFGNTSPSASVTAATLASSNTYLYLSLPLPPSGKIKLGTKTDLTLTKLLSETYLIAPPLYREEQVIGIPVFDARGMRFGIHVEVKSVRRGLGLGAAGSGSGNGRRGSSSSNAGTGEEMREEAEGEGWKYKLLHGNVWLSEREVNIMVAGLREGHAMAW